MGKTRPALSMKLIYYSINLLQIHILTFCLILFTLLWSYWFLLVYFDVNCVSLCFGYESNTGLNVAKYFYSKSKMLCSSNAMFSRQWYIFYDWQYFSFSFSQIFSLRNAVICIFLVISDAYIWY